MNQCYINLGSLSLLTRLHVKERDEGTDLANAGLLATTKAGDLTGHCAKFCLTRILANDRASFATMTFERILRTLQERIVNGGHRLCAVSDMAAPALLS